jgi:ArsR family transcriptional regulator
VVRAIASKRHFKNDDLTDYGIFNEGAAVIRGINHHIRFKLIANIHAAQRITVKELYTSLRLSQSVVSQHLSVLRSLHIVECQREKNVSWYSINYDTIFRFKKLLTQLTDGYDL